MSGYVNKYLKAFRDILFEKYRSKNLKTSRDLQLMDSGEGPVYHRKYWVEFSEPKVPPVELLNKLKVNQNLFVDPKVALFEKTKGEMDLMKVGDEFLVHIAGPWDGPTVVIDVTGTSFTFQTLEGNIESGQINFRVEERAGGVWRFTIESMSRSKDVLVDLMYDKLLIARMGQTKMWTDVCQSFYNFSTSRKEKSVNVITEKCVNGKWIKA